MNRGISMRQSYTLQTSRDDSVNSVNINTGNLEMAGTQKPQFPHHVDEHHIFLMIFSGTSR
jgi:hypothetical protein